MSDYSYTVTEPGGLVPAYTMEDERPYIALADKVLAYEYVDFEGTTDEFLMLIGTTATLAGEETVFAERTWDFEVESAHNLGLYVYDGRVAALGYQNVWEVTSVGAQTVVPIVEAMQYFMPPTYYVRNEGQATLRMFEYYNGVFGPEDAQIWAVVPDPDVDSRPMLPVYSGITRHDIPETESLVDLPGDEPYVLPVRLDAGMEGEGMYFAPQFDPEVPDGMMPGEFWNNARFYYTWNTGDPSGVGGSVTTRLVANYEGSTLDIAGDGIGDGSLISNGGVAAAGYAGGYSSPYFWLVPEWTIHPPTGPDYLENIADKVDECWIEGSYTVTPAVPFRQTLLRSEYEFHPASDLVETALDGSDWGAPEDGAGTQESTTTWMRSGSMHWTAVAAVYQTDYYPYGSSGPSDYFLSRFTIAIRSDEAPDSTIVAEFDLVRARFTG